MNGRFASRYRVVAVVALLALSMLAASIVGVASDAPEATPGATPSATPTLRPGACVAEGSKRSDPVVFLGDTAGVTLTFRAYCGGYVQPLHIVLVLDASDAMAEEERDMEDAATSLVENLTLDENPATRVGVVAFSDQARTLAPVTGDRSRALAAIRRVHCSGSSRPDAGLEKAQYDLLAARRTYGSELPAGRSAAEVVVLISAGHTDDDCSAAPKSADDLKRDGVLILAVCSVRDCQSNCMRRIASSPRYYFDLRHVPELLAVFQPIRHKVRNTGIKQLTVDDALPADMPYLGYGALPRPTLVSADGRHLTWIASFVPPDGITFTYRVAPSQIGTRAVNVAAAATWVTTFDETGSLAYGVPTVLVVAPPTATPTATWTALPTPRPTEAASATPSPSPTAASWRLFAPAAGRDAPWISALGQPAQLRQKERAAGSEHR